MVDSWKGQGKLPMDVVTDNALLRRKYEQDELAGQVPAMVTTTPDGGVDLSVNDGGAIKSIIYTMLFPDFAPSIVASFVAGTTASQTGNTVTVTATAHGIVGNTSRNGYRIWYPGSTNIPAGWYSGFAWVDANTITFQRQASATVSSESVNAGAIFTSQVTLGTYVLRASSLGPRGRFTVCFQRSGDASTSQKFVRVFLGGVQVSSSQLTTTPIADHRLTIRNVSEAAQLGQATNDAIATTTAVVSAAIDTTTNQTVSVTASLSLSASWIAIPSLEIEIARLA